jgi:CubicO group peptidase (beta-lactamase class C family)
MPSALLTACLLALAQAPAANAKAGAFDELMLRHAAEGFSGSVLVARRGTVLCAQGYGFADFDANLPNDADTLFEIASITKPFTATAIVKLAQQGRLALDDSIARHLPGVPEPSRAITLRQLLSHTSGIPRGNGAGRGDDLAKAVVEYLGTGPRHAPGTRYEYWNGGYALLAGVIERASGRSYTQYLEEELFAPAGMRSTGFTGDTDLDPARDALGISSKGAPRRALEHPYGSYGYQYRGMGGIVTSVLDLYRFDRALAQDLVLDEAHARELFTPVKEGYALGWKIGRAAGGGVRQSHGGGVRAFVSEFRRYPEQDACIAVLCNRDDRNPGEVADHLEALLFDGTLVRPPTGEALDERRGAACAGTYSNSAGTVVVRAARGVLWAGIEGAKLVDLLGANEPLDWKADAGELARNALAVVEGLAKGDVEPLRARQAKRIPADWPDRVKGTVWPAQTAKHGAFRSARLLGTRARAGRLEVLLAVEHERGTAHALIAFGADGLERLEWNGPSFPLEARISMQGQAAALVLPGDEPPKLVLEFAAGKVAAVRLAGQRLVRQ